MLGESDPEGISPTGRSQRYGDTGARGDSQLQRATVRMGESEVWCNSIHGRSLARRETVA